MPKEINNVTLQIKENINLLINNGQLEEAKILVDEYKRMVSDDIEIYSIKAVISIMEGNFDEAKDILNNGLKIDNNNFDLNYNLAYLYEENGEYLDALETYEKIVFNLKNDGQRQQIIEYLNKLEDEHREVIQRQLEESKKYGEVICEYEKKKINLHLMYDSPYCDKFIQLVNENFDISEHRFIIIHNKNNKLEFMNIDGVDNAQIIDLNFQIIELLNYIKECSRVFIHYLFDYFCEMVCKFNINKPMYWPLWGGDLYNYIDMEIYEPKTKQLLNKLGYNIDDKINKNTISYVYRKATIRRIKFILRINDGEYEKIKKNFITNAKRISFFYSNPVDFFIINNKINVKIDEKYNLKKRNKNVILVGNSANPSNNHVDILERIKNIKVKDLCIIMPLSYGGSQNYITEIIKYGNKAFGNKFVPITDYLDSNIYFELLKQVDIAIFNYNRQQGLSNISALIYLGKKVYMNTKAYNWFDNKGIKVFDIDELYNIREKDFQNMDFNIVNNNKQILKDTIYDDVCIGYLNEIFLDYKK